MSKFLSISSGSSGNCYYIGNEKTALVVDMGVSGRNLKKRLSEAGISTDSIEMILVTHDHIDHIKYLGTVVERLKVPVFTTSKIHASLAVHTCTRDYIGGCARVIKKEVFTENRGVKFVAFGVPHDATETVGYYIDFFGDKYVFMTDLGDVPQSALDFACEADYLILESNYDLEMLNTGNYTYELKKRISENRGHLSNDQCASALRKIYNGKQKSIFLCHLSENNNTPDKAYKSAFDALASVGAVVGKDVRLYCLPRKEASPLFIF